jgi:hypothetical protein
MVLLDNAAFTMPSLPTDINLNLNVQLILSIFTREGLTLTAATSFLEVWAQEHWRCMPDINCRLQSHVDIDSLKLEHFSSLEMLQSVMQVSSIQLSFNIAVHLLMKGLFFSHNQSGPFHPPSSALHPARSSNFCLSTFAQTPIGKPFSRKPEASLTKFQQERLYSFCLAASVMMTAWKNPERSIPCFVMLWTTVSRHTRRWRREDHGVHAKAVESRR